MKIKGQNLIQNPGAEWDPLTNGWTKVKGDWISGTEVPAYEGLYHFFAGADSSVAEIFQDVDVNAFADKIDSGLALFHFRAFVRDFDNMDESQIILEYRDATDSIVDSFISSAYDSVIWKQVSDSRLAPLGTRTIRVRLLSTHNFGIDSDGYFDALVLNEGQNPLGIDVSPKSNFNVGISPNPTSGLMVIKGDGLHDIKVFNTLGKDMTKQVKITYSNEEVLMDLSELESGLYYLYDGRPLGRVLKE